MERTNRKVYTMEEVAEQLGIGRTSAYRLAEQGVFPVLRLGRRLVVPKAKFDSWLSGDGHDTESA